MAATHQATLHISCWQQEQLVPNGCSFTPTYERKNNAQQGAAGGADPSQKPARNKVKGGKAADAEEDAEASVRPAPRTLDSRLVMPAYASQVMISDATKLPFSLHLTLPLNRLCGWLMVPQLT
jgi:hypothetical protein